MKKIFKFVLAIVIAFSFASLCKLQADISAAISVLNSPLAVAPEVLLVREPEPESESLDTKHEFTDGSGNKVIVRNSYPRGGQWIKDVNGTRYIYAVFWSQVQNSTHQDLGLEIAFPNRSLFLSELPDRSFRILVPSDVYTKEKDPLENYGLDVEKYMHSQIETGKQFMLTIKPGETRGMYFVVLFNKGVDGTLRAGLEFVDDKIQYRVNKSVFDCCVFEKKEY